MFAKVFPSNEHKVERVIRIALGLAVLSLAFIGPRTPWAYLGVIPLVTGLLGSCPLYTLFGISTCTLRHRTTS
ncbi:MAG: DUF2892 domain-containing protein [Labilithrix sp.]|mgnify:CR=1 FL=1